MNILVFRYNISFVDTPLGVLGEIFPSAKYFTSGNISPNTPRSGSINDKYISPDDFSRMKQAVVATFLR